MRDLGSLLTGMVAMILALILIIYMMSGCYVTIPESSPVCTPAEYKVCSYTVEAACRPGELVRNCRWEMLRRESCWCVKPNPGWYR